MPIGDDALERCFSVDQAARILGTSATTVRRLIRSNLIVHQRISPGRVVIRESALRAYLQEVDPWAKPWVTPLAGSVPPIPPRAVGSSSGR